MPSRRGFKSSLRRNTRIKLADELQQIVRGRARLLSIVSLPRRFYRQTACCFIQATYTRILSVP